jgi:hypothetical protein
MSACPIPFERLVDAVAGEMSESEEQALEVHVFACDICGDAYASVARLVAGLRGYIPPVISQQRLARLRATGTRLTFTPVLPGTRVAVRFGADVEMLVHALHGDLRDAERIDVALESMQGQSLTTFESVAFDRARGEVLIACQRHYMEHGFPAELRFRVQAHTDGGVRHVGDYVVDHLF